MVFSLHDDDDDRERNAKIDKTKDWIKNIFVEMEHEPLALGTCQMVLFDE